MNLTLMDRCNNIWTLNKYTSRILLNSNVFVFFKDENPADQKYPKSIFSCSRKLLLCFFSREPPYVNETKWRRGHERLVE